MEDTSVLKGYFAYMLRVDIDYEKALPLFHKWRDKYHCTHYILGLEFGLETGKPHIQGIVWFECLQSVTKLRNYFRNKVNPTKQSVALTSAKKITNLSKYCMKDGIYETNLSPSQIESIGKWNVGDGSNYKFLKDLYDHVEELQRVRNDEIKNDIMNNTTPIGEYQMIMRLLEFYRAKERRPNKSTIEYLLWKYNICTDNDWYIRHYQ